MLAPHCGSMRHWLATLAVVLLVSGAIYLYVYTPLPVYILDKLNLRQFFLPNILCHNCTHVNYGYLINDAALCGDAFLLNVVISFHPNVRSRTAIRETWGSVTLHAGRRVRTIFAFGVHKGQRFNEQLAIENAAHGDILQINFTEDYRHLTEKSLAILQWFAAHCPDTAYLLKTDDDSFNHVARIVDYLVSVQQEQFVGGYCFTVMPDRREGSKYYISQQFYPDQYYPTYCAGPGYVLSRAAVLSILGIYQNVMYLPMEDVYIAGLCRVAAHIPYTQIPGMIVGEPQLTACDLATWAKNTHNVVPERMRTLWERAIRANQAVDCRGRHLWQLLYGAVGLGVWFWIMKVVLHR